MLRWAASTREAAHSVRVGARIPGSVLSVPLLPTCEELVKSFQASVPSENEGLGLHCL